MTDVELAALSELVRAETEAMSWTNDHREMLGQSVAYTTDEWEECDSVKALKKELRIRGIRTFKKPSS